jgi:hypothetical protein
MLRAIESYLRIGFDRMATVAVACRGRSLASLNFEQNITANNDNAVAGRFGFTAAPVRMAA